MKKFQTLVALKISSHLPPIQVLIAISSGTLNMFVIFNLQWYGAQQWCGVLNAVLRGGSPGDIPIPILHLHCDIKSGPSEVSGGARGQFPIGFWPKQKQNLFYQKIFYYWLPSLSDFETSRRICKLAFDAIRCEWHIMFRFATRYPTAYTIYQALTPSL